VGGGADCSADNNNCYKVPVCTLANDTSITKTYDCQIDLQYYADSTDAGGRFADENWVADVQVWDKSGAGQINNSVTKEIATILSVDIPSSISYGNSFSLGQKTTSADNQEMVITQTGNDETDVQVSGTDMTCSLGSIPAGNQKWALSDVGYTSGSSTPLTHSSDNTFIDVGYRDNDNASTTKTLYWNLGIPDSGVKGNCVGANTIVAIAHVNQGYLLDSATANVNYYSPSFDGVTDNNGRFLYATGETVTFKIGSTTLGATNVMPMDGYLTIPDLVGVARDNNTDPKVLNVARFLQSIDSDGDPTNGITITDQVKTALANTVVDLQTATISDINTIVVDLGKTLVTADFAQNHIHDTYLFVVGGNKLNGYAWAEKTGYISFSCSNNNNCSNSDYGVYKNNSNELYGYAWGEQIGWINFKGSNYGVTVGTSTLSGYAWGEQTGWISFNCANDNSCGTSDYGVTIDQNGNLDGYAWSEQTGYIHMKGSNYGAVLIQ
jgi:hypothetical protein